MSLEWGKREVGRGEGNTKTEEWEKEEENVEKKKVRARRKMDRQQEKCGLYKSEILKLVQFGLDCVQILNFGCSPLRPCYKFERERIPKNGILCNFYLPTQTLMFIYDRAGQRLKFFNISPIIYIWLSVFLIPSYKKHEAIVHLLWWILLGCGHEVSTWWTI